MFSSFLDSALHRSHNTVPGTNIEAVVYYSEAKARWDTCVRDFLTKLDLCAGPPLKTFKQLLDSFLDLKWGQQYFL